MPRRRDRFVRRSGKDDKLAKSVKSLLIVALTRLNKTTEQNAISKRILSIILEND